MTRQSAAPGSMHVEDGFRHEALFYAGEADFVERTNAFIADALADDDPILVVVSREKIELLQRALGADAGRVSFGDMATIGRNPSTIIPAWRDFLSKAKAEGRRPRGIGEPIYADRSADELAECHLHESLLNLAFADSPAFWLVCPYDTSSLAPTILDEALENHPFILDAAGHRTSSTYRDARDVAKPFDAPLPPPQGPVETIEFKIDMLAAVRRHVGERASRFGLEPARAADLVFAVNELTTNSLRHSGSHGRLTTWTEGRTLICEVEDEGGTLEPLVGRLRPSVDRESGYGLWLVNHLCDLVQMRRYPDRNVVRLHMRR